ncbi:MAG: hypothetical protein GDA48_17045 [Hormoscilla sp. GM102CHS1]|nr:hypothetical protein [Hormoscilla sp. GM102CHS1]
MHIQQLKEEQELILSQVDNAIALFDRSQHLVLFNHKLAQMSFDFRAERKTSFYGSVCLCGRTGILVESAV